MDREKARDRERRRERREERGEKREEGKERRENGEGKGGKGGRDIALMMITTLLSMSPLSCIPIYAHLPCIANTLSTAYLLSQH